MKFRLLSCVIILCIFTSQAWGRPPYWMLEQINEFFELCTSATTSEIDNTLKKFDKEKRGRLLHNSNGKGETALSAALQHNSDTGIANVLIKFGANPAEALTLAVEEKNRNAISALLKAFPDTLDKLSFLMLCRVGPYSMIEEKLKNGANPNPAPSHVAAEDNPDPKVLNLLIDYGADPDPVKLLHHAALGGNVNVIDELLKSGANVDIQDKSGSTALMVAAAQAGMYICCTNFDDHPEEYAINGIKALLKAGANVNAQSKFGGNTALHIASTWGRIETVKVLLKAGADVNIQGSNNATALISACNSRNPKPEVILALLDAGANVNIKDGKGNRAIDYARQRENLVGTEAFLRLVKASR